MPDERFLELGKEIVKAAERTINELKIFKIREKGKRRPSGHPYCEPVLFSCLSLHPH